MFATLSDRLADTFKHLRGKGKLSEADYEELKTRYAARALALLEAGDAKGGCTACGATLVADARYCQICGTAV